MNAGRGRSCIKYYTVRVCTSGVRLLVLTASVVQSALYDAVGDELVAAGRTVIGRRLTALLVAEPGQCSSVASLYLLFHYSVLARRCAQMLQ